MGMTLVEVTPKFVNMARREKFKIGITRAIFGNVSVARTWCEIKIGRVYKK